MKQNHNGAEENKALDELYERYENRGRNYGASKFATEQAAREIKAHSASKKAYRAKMDVAARLSDYRSGIEGAKTYMTEGDFADYYKDSRDYVPEKRSKLDTAVLLDGIDRERYERKAKPEAKQKGNVKEKLRAEADKVNPKIERRMEIKSARPAPQASSAQKPSRSPMADAPAKKVNRAAPTPASEAGGDNRIHPALILIFALIGMSLIFIAIGAAILLFS